MYFNTVYFWILTNMCVRLHKQASQFITEHVTTENDIHYSSCKGKIQVKAKTVATEKIVDSIRSTQ